MCVCVCVCVRERERERGLIKIDTEIEDSFQVLFTVASAVDRSGI